MSILIVKRWLKVWFNHLTTQSDFLFQAQTPWFFKSLTPAQVCRRNPPDWSSAFITLTGQKFLTVFVGCDVNMLLWQRSRPHPDNFWKVAALHHRWPIYCLHISPTLSVLDGFGILSSPISARSGSTQPTGTTRDLLYIIASVTVVWWDGEVWKKPQKNVEQKRKWETDS